MQLANPSKALIALVALISMVILIALERITQEAGMNIVIAIVFYSIGNGVGTDSKGNITGIIGRKPKE
jgi:MFS superfamily sulfate permease-like transporter